MYIIEYMYMECRWGQNPSRSSTSMSNIDVQFHHQHLKCWWWNLNHWYLILIYVRFNHQYSVSIKVPYWLIFHIDQCLILHAPQSLSPPHLLICPLVCNVFSLLPWPATSPRSVSQPCLLLSPLATHVSPEHGSHWNCGIQWRATGLLLRFKKTCLA